MLRVVAIHRSFVWFALAIYALAAPVATLSHRHSGRCGDVAGCGGCGPRPLHAAASQAERQGAPEVRVAWGRCAARPCGRPSCRVAVDPGASAPGPAVANRPSAAAAVAPCVACRFLAQFVAAVAQADREPGVAALRPEPPPRFPEWVAPVAAAFLARGPPA